MSNFKEPLHVKAGGIIAALAAVGGAIAAAGLFFRIDISLPVLSILVSAVASLGAVIATRPLSDAWRAVVPALIGGPGVVYASWYYFNGLFEGRESFMKLEIAAAIIAGALPSIILWAVLKKKD